MHHSPSLPCAPTHPRAWPPTLPPTPPHTRQAFEKNPKDADTLANLAVVSLHLGKSAQRYLGMLKSAAPGHPAVKRAAEGEAAFDRAASGITA